MQVAAHERLASRQPDLADAVRDKNTRQPGDFLEAQDLIALEELVI
jgi:hypothetical protein